MKTIVDRSKWGTPDNPNAISHCDEGSGFSGLLLDDNGCMCCLGFSLKKCGVADKALRGNTMPSDIVRDLHLEDEDEAPPELVEAGLVQAIGGCDTVMSYDASSINDLVHLEPFQRERALRDLFASHGHEIEFIGQRPPRYE